MGTLKSRESQYARNLIEASLDPLFTISPEGKITDINKASVVVVARDITDHKRVEKELKEAKKLKQSESESESGSTLFNA
ncbi:MAG: hypothetical protein R6W81_11040 [Bacteroidales bacterium]